MYKAAINIQIGTNTSDGSVGVGGSPGSSVYIKAGMTYIEPLAILHENGHYRMNIDKGNQSQGGQDMVVIGDFSNGTSENRYTLKNLSNENPFEVEANENGELWVTIGTDSGFEGTTTIYYNKISITFE